MECDPNGFNARPDLCRQVDIRRFPTWIVGAERLEGVLSLERLALLSKFPQAKP